MSSNMSDEKVRFLDSDSEKGDENEKFLHEEEAVKYLESDNEMKPLILNSLDDSASISNEQLCFRCSPNKETCDSAPSVRYLESDDGMTNLPTIAMSSADTELRRPPRQRLHRRTTTNSVVDSEDEYLPSGVLRVTTCRRRRRRRRITNSSAIAYRSARRRTNATIDTVTLPVVPTATVPTNIAESSLNERRSEFAIINSNPATPIRNLRLDDCHCCPAIDVSSPRSAMTPAGVRPRSTRREARRAILRISLSTNIIEQQDDSDNTSTEFEDESIVRLEEISMASEDESSKWLMDEEDGENSKEKANESIMCVICAESEAVKPVKTTCCCQPVGCKNCVKRWYRTTNISDLNQRSPLSRGQSHENHKRCLFCRTAWPTRMLITAL